MGWRIETESWLLLIVAFQRRRSAVNLTYVCRRCCFFSAMMLCKVINFLGTTNDLRYRHLFSPYKNVLQGIKASLLLYCVHHFHTTTTIVVECKWLGWTAAYVNRSSAGLVWAAARLPQRRDNGDNNYMGMAFMAMLI